MKWNRSVGLAVPAVHMAVDVAKDAATSKTPFVVRILRDGETHTALLTTEDVDALIVALHWAKAEVADAKS